MVSYFKIAYLFCAPFLNVISGHCSLRKFSEFVFCVGSNFPTFVSWQFHKLVLWLVSRIHGDIFQRACKLLGYFICRLPLDSHMFWKQNPKNFLKMSRSRSGNIKRNCGFVGHSYFFIFIFFSGWSLSCPHKHMRKYTHSNYLRGKRTSTLELSKKMSF